MLQRDPQATFFARVWLTEEDIDSIELWCHELHPIDGKLIPTEEWVRDYLEGENDRNRYIDLIGQEDPKAPRDGCYQLLLRGTITGHFDYYNEYDEWVDFQECKWVKLPEDWFSKMESENASDQD